jgi:formate hydrogenlyase subunit 4
LVLGLLLIAVVLVPWVDAHQADGFAAVCEGTTVHNVAPVLMALVT